MSKKIIIDNELGSLKVEYLNGVPFVHSTLKKWSPTLYKAYLQVWDRFLYQMSQEGHPCVFVAIPENDEKLLKFEKMFGFEEVSHENGIVILVKDTE